jgi:hypothetical protein
LSLGSFEGPSAAAGIGAVRAGIGAAELITRPEAACSAAARTIAGAFARSALTA